MNIFNLTPAAGRPFHVAKYSLSFRYNEDIAPITSVLQQAYGPGKKLSIEPLDQEDALWYWRTGSKRTSCTTIYLTTAEQLFYVKLVQ
jgi:hypothetical protein